MPTRSHYEAATRHEGDVLVAVTEIEPLFQSRGMAVVLDLRRRQPIAGFPVRYETGGGPRLAIAATDSACFAGCYEAFGLAAYAIPEGTELWRRKDLKSVQEVQMLPSLAQLFCGRETGAAHLLDPQTGRTRQRLTGVKAIFGSPYDPSVVVVGRRTLQLHRPFGIRVRDLVRLEHVRQCAFSPDRLVVLDFKALRGFDRHSGEPIWSLAREDRGTFTRCAWHPARKCFVAQRRGHPAGAFVFLTPDRGEVLQEVRHDAGPEGEFCQNGSAWFAGDMRLLSTADGTLLHDFTTDEMRRLDPLG